LVVNCNLQRLDGRCAATARSSRSSRAFSRGRRAGTSSRSSGAPSGTSCWPATSTGVLVGPR
jgi:hypothetical protein